MKITLNKQAITLAEVQAAKELQASYAGALDAKTLENMACRATGQNGTLIKVEELEVTKHKHELTIWATVILESYDRFIKTSFDVLQADNPDRDYYDNYTRVFMRQEN